MPTKVNDTCSVISSSKLVTQSTETKKKTTDRNGTRVFHFLDEDYCNPYYVHDDNEWAVFICFQQDRIEEAVSIIKSYPGQSEMFKTDVHLARLGAFYPLVLFDQFGEINIDKYPARYEGINDISKWVNITLNKKPWIPSAEVLQSLAVLCSYVYPSGNLVVEDSNGYPNLKESNPYLLDYLLHPETPPELPNGFLLSKTATAQKQRMNEIGNFLGKSYNQPRWTNTTIHIHPVGRYIFNLNNSEQCFNKMDKEVDIKTDNYQYDVKSTYNKYGHSSYPDIKPSDGDWRVIVDEQHTKNVNNEYFRSIYIDRFFIYLYGVDGAIMTIRRKTPNINYVP